MRESTEIAQLEKRIRDAWAVIYIMTVWLLLLTAPLFSEVLEYWKRR